MTVMQRVGKMQQSHLYRIQKKTVIYVEEVSSFSYVGLMMKFQYISESVRKGKETG